jgi:hypothetical protein
MFLKNGWVLKTIIGIDQEFNGCDSPHNWLAPMRYRRSKNTPLRMLTLFLGMNRD